FPGCLMFCLLSVCHMGSSRYSALSRLPARLYARSGVSVADKTSAAIVKQILRSRTHFYAQPLHS
ncbi:MAG: hypothetical protein AAGJ80_17970, partial [Cyanobacteria bacterium J06553_1]